MKLKLTVPAQTGAVLCIVRTSTRAGRGRERVEIEGIDTIPVSNRGNRTVLGELDNYSCDAYSRFSEALGLGVVTSEKRDVELLTASDPRALDWLRVRHYQPYGSRGLSEICLCWPWCLVPSEAAARLAEMSETERQAIGA
jgi:hypothetical protein